MAVAQIWALYQTGAQPRCPAQFPGTYGMPWEIVEVNGLLRVIMTGNGICHNSFRERSRAFGAAQRAARARLSSMFFDELAAIVRRSRGTDLTAASIGASSRGRSGGVHGGLQTGGRRHPELMAIPVTRSRSHTGSSPGPGVELQALAGGRSLARRRT